MIRRHAPRRRQILDAAARVFAALGYDAATTAAICREAGVGSGTLFHYFPDKHSLFAELLEDDFTTLQQLLAAPKPAPICEKAELGHPHPSSDALIWRGSWIHVPSGPPRRAPLSAWGGAASLR